MIDDVVAIGRDLRPDLVLVETYVLAGPLAAEVLAVGEDERRRRGGRRRRRAGTWRSSG